MVLNCKTIFQRASKQANKKKICENKAFPSFRQANRSKVFRTCTVVLGSHTCIVVLPGQQIWSYIMHLKETVARTGVYKVMSSN